MPTNLHTRRRSRKTYPSALKPLIWIRNWIRSLPSKRSTLVPENEKANVSSDFFRAGEGTPGCPLGRSTFCMARGRSAASQTDDRYRSYFRQRLNALPMGANHTQIQGVHAECRLCLYRGRIESLHCRHDHDRRCAGLCRRNR